MKYLKYFEQASAYESYKNGSDYVTPNVSYAADNNVVYYNPFAESTSGVIMAHYSATEDNMLALADTSNVKSLKVNDTEVEFGNTYYFSEIGEYDVEIELIDPTLINGMIMDENRFPLSNSMFWGILDNRPTGACLTAIVIPDSVTIIGDSAFQNCSGLTSIVITDSVTTIGESAFAMCIGLTSVVIGSGVTSIGRYAFNYCTGLTGELVIPDSVTSIGDEAFAYCSGLTSVHIGSGITSISGWVFQNCSGLTGKLVIPDSVKTIGTIAFAYCSGLTSVIIPDSVTSIDNYAFYGCTSLPVEDNLRYADTYLVGVADKTLSTYTIKENTKWVGARAFENCSGLTSIVIPNSVTSIGEMAFRNCTSLTGELVIPDSVTIIGDGAFQNCSGLTGELVIPDSVNSIGSSAFYNCSGLTGDLVIPNYVTSIGYEAFYRCKGLTSVVIGSGVTSIEQYTFQSCYGLNVITCHATTAPSIRSHAFNGIKQNGILKVPAGSDYSSWMSNDEYYLGYYNWTIEYI